MLNINIKIINYLSFTFYKVEDIAAKYSHYDTLFHNLEGILAKILNLGFSM